MTPRLTSRPLLLAGLLALGAPTSAEAGVVTGDVLDGPSAQLVSAGDLDVSRDGTGAVAYRKEVDGVPHVFVSRLVAGAFTAPERLDGGLAGAAGEPVVATADGGRVAVAFLSGGQLQAVLRPNAGSPFGAPQPIADGASEPAIDMSIFGVGYISFTAPGGGGTDVRVARVAREAPSFGLLPDALDGNPAGGAGTGTGRSRVAVSADGTAVVVWGEADQVIARRVFGVRLSTAPQVLNAGAVDGHAGGAADLPEIEIEDDSSYAWAIIRQGFDDGRRHVVARRLVGSAFEAPTFIDGTGFPAPADASETALAMSGRGEGIAATSAGGGVNGAILHDNLFAPGRPLGPGGTPSHPAVGIAENNDAFAAWLPGDGTVQLRAYDIDPALRDVPAAGPAASLSTPALGSVVPEGGLDLSVNRAGDAHAVFLQDGPDGRRLVSGSLDRAPGAFRTFSSSRFRRFARPPLVWQSAFDLLGPVSYRVEIDGQPVGETTATKLTPANVVADGVHSWRVVATDRRGQTTATPVRPLRVDALAPELAVRVTGKRAQRQLLTIRTRAADGSLVAPVGSGVKGLRIDFGDGTVPVSTPVATHRYARNGTFTVRVSATDRAGNVAVETVRVVVKKAKRR